jgi:hypothetical protein
MSAELKKRIFMTLDSGPGVNSRPVIYKVSGLPDNL